MVDTTPVLLDRWAAARARWDVATAALYAPDPDGNPSYIDSPPERRAVADAMRALADVAEALAPRVAQLQVDETVLLRLVQRFRSASMFFAAFCKERPIVGDGGVDLTLVDEADIVVQRIQIRGMAEQEEANEAYPRGLRDPASYDAMTLAVVCRLCDQRGVEAVRYSVVREAVQREAGRQLPWKEASKRLGPQGSLVSRGWVKHDGANVSRGGDPELTLMKDGRQVWAWLQEERPDLHGDGRSSILGTS